MIGTIVNCGAVVLGSTVGLMVHSRLPERFQKIVFQGLGIITAVLGVSMALKSDNLLIVVLSVVIGSVLGEWIDIDSALRSLTSRLTKGRGNERFIEGFMTSSLLFCVGTMAILGAIEDGVGSTPTLLYTKAVMDGVTSVALAASFGVGVMFSALSLLVYQGAITLGAVWLTAVMSEQMITQMTATGGILLIGLGITVLQIKEIRIANMLPSLIIAIIITYFTT